MSKIMNKALKEIKIKDNNWSWFFYQGLGYMITDDESEKEVLNNVMDKLLEKTRQETADEIFSKILSIKRRCPQCARKDNKCIEVYDIEELKKKFVPSSLKPPRGFKEDKNAKENNM